jgi:murein DD-endopeptidase MepM/ murein hydrolase activator NlpD
MVLLFCLRAPVPGPVVAPYAPIGRYEGHWGVDLAAPLESPVRAAGDGVVTFAGTVAGMMSVTIDHGGGARSSVSYLSGILVGEGARIEAGTIVGRSGRSHQTAAVHFSVRIDGAYTDPLPHLMCVGSPGHLYLLPPPASPVARRRLTPVGDIARGRSYPQPGAHRLTRRNLRSSPHSSPVSG